MAINLRTLNPRMNTLPWSQKLAYGVGHVLNDLCSSMWFSYLLVFFRKVLMFSNEMAGYVMLLGQVADAICTPFIGYESDRTRGCRNYGQRKTWHVIGCFCVTISFPFIFLRCPGCENSDDWAEFIYYAPFIVIFQFGWASSQISHLSLIPELTPHENERVGLNAIRCAFQVLSSLVVYSMAWVFIGAQSTDTLGKSHENAFRNLALTVVGVGFIFVLVYHIVLKEKEKPKRYCNRIKQKQKNSSKDNCKQDNHNPDNCKQDKANQENCNQDSTILKKHNHDNTNQENCNQDNTNQENCNKDNHNQDSTTLKNHNQDNTNQENCDQDNTNQDNCNQDNTSQENCNQDNTRQDKCNQDNHNKDNHKQENTNKDIWNQDNHNKDNHKQDQERCNKGNHNKDNCKHDNHTQNDIDNQYDNQNHCNGMPAIIKCEEGDEQVEVAHPKQRRHVGVLDWLKEHQFYQVAIVYMATRLTVNLSQVYMPVYLTDTLHLPTTYIAIVPLVVFLSGFGATLVVKIINRVIGRKLTYVLGALLVIGASTWFFFLSSETHTWQVIMSSVMVGFGNHTILVTSLSVLADLIGKNTSSGAFVYGCMSFVDKLSNGIAIVLIQNLQPCPDSQVCCPDCVWYYQYMMAFVPSSMVVLGIAGIISLSCMTIGDLNIFRGVTESDAPSSYSGTGIGQTKDLQDSTPPQATVVGLNQTHVDAVSNPQYLHMVQETSKQIPECPEQEHDINEQVHEQTRQSESSEQEQSHENIKDTEKHMVQGIENVTKIQENLAKIQENLKKIHIGLDEIQKYPEQAEGSLNNSGPSNQGQENAHQADENLEKEIFDQKYIDESHLEGKEEEIKQMEEVEEERRQEGEKREEEEKWEEERVRSKWGKEVLVKEDERVVVKRNSEMEMGRIKREGETENMGEENEHMCSTESVFVSIGDIFGVIVD